MASLMAMGFGIEQVVSAQVKERYDRERDAMEAEMHFAKKVDCVLTKEKGESPVCRFFNEDGDEIQLPYTRDFIECVASNIIRDMKANP